MPGRLRPGRPGMRYRWSAAAMSISDGRSPRRVPTLATNADQPSRLLSDKFQPWCGTLSATDMPILIDTCVRDCLPVSYRGRTLLDGGRSGGRGRGRGCEVGLINRLQALIDQGEARHAPVNAGAPAAPQSRPAPGQAKPKGKAAAAVADPWVAFGQSVTVAGLQIHGGLLHVGDRMATRNAYDQPEASLIRPSLKVDLARPDVTGASVGYWPSYSALSPQARAGYLLWLAGGRNDPNAPIGYVFVYFYGLERRLLIDMHRAGTASVERPVLLDEVRRLLDVYGHDHSLRTYAGRLLEAATPLDGARRYDSPPPSDLVEWTFELPYEVALALGQLVVDGKPIPSDWALAWWKTHPQSRPRTVTHRCPAVFTDLFTLLYEQRHGPGLLVKPSKKQLVRQYRPASPNLHSGFTLQAGVPDVGDLTGPFNKLNAIASAAMDALDGYSRFIGKNPGQEGSPQALALLPEQVAGAADSTTTALLAWAKGAVLRDRESLVPVDELSRRWGAAKFGKAELDAAGRLLGRVAVGIEPDVRFGGAAPKAGGEVVLFRRADPQVNEASAAYAGAQALLQLAGSVAAADGRIVEAELSLLVEHVAHGVGLSDDEQARLRAHLMWVSDKPTTPAVLRKRIEALSAGQREQAARLMVAVAAADGQISPAEVDLIAKMFDALGFEANEAYAQVHALAAGGGALRRSRAIKDDLAAARTAGTPAPGFALPPRDERHSAPLTPRQPRPKKAVVRGSSSHRPAGGAVPPEPAAAEFALDPTLLEQTRRDSEQVAALLADIFVDDDGPVASAATAASAPGAGGLPATLSAPAAGPQVPLVNGLDAAHSALLRTLATQQSWPAADFEALCATHGLLPAGALLTLNEAAYETTDGPVAEGADPILIDSETLEEML